MNFLKNLTFTAVVFLFLAALFVIFYVVCELAGWREHTTFITGTAASDRVSLQMSASRGTTYMVLYFGFVLVVPILTLAAGIHSVITWKLRRVNRNLNP